jgi:hypothetical protein
VLKLISLTKPKTEDFQPPCVKATYEVIHTEGYNTKLTQELDVTICERTGKVTGAFHITELEAASVPEALAKLAVWCERMAIALREPMRITASVPVFEPEPAAESAQRKFEEGGLTQVRLQALANGKGISSADALRAAHKLFQEGYISYPEVAVAFLPGNREWVAPHILANIEQVFPGVCKNAAPRRDAPVFLAPYPYNQHAIVPSDERPRDAAHFFELSETERTVYRIVAEEYVRAISEPPGGVLAEESPSE